MQNKLKFCLESTRRYHDLLYFGPRFCLFRSHLFLYSVSQGWERRFKCWHSFWQHWTISATLPITCPNTTLRLRSSSYHPPWSDNGFQKSRKWREMPWWWTFSITSEPPFVGNRCRHHRRHRPKKRRMSSSQPTKHWRKSPKGTETQLAVAPRRTH